MKQGNQFFLEIQIYDEKEELLNIEGVEKVQFNIEDMTKIYGDDSKDVTYDEESKCFKIWLTQSETFKFESNTKFEARVLFKNGVILGTLIEEEYVYASLKKEELNA